RRHAVGTREQEKWKAQLRAVSLSPGRASLATISLRSAAQKRRRSGVGQKFVLVNHSGDVHLIVRAAFHSNHAAPAADPDALGESDFRWQRQSEVNGRSGLNAGIDEEADAPRAHVARLRRVLVAVVAVAHGDG